MIHNSHWRAEKDNTDSEDNSMGGSNSNEGLEGSFGSEMKDAWESSDLDYDLFAKDVESAIMQR
jgi:hypothetical protein